MNRLKWKKKQKSKSKIKFSKGSDERSYPASEVRGGGREDILYSPKPEARGGSQEDKPQFQGAMAAWAK